MKKIKISPKAALVLKVVVTVGICTWIIYHIEWHAMRQAAMRANPWVVLVAFGCMVVSVGVSASKWRMLLKINQMHFRWRALFGYYLSAGFFSSILPGIIGGDGYRIYKTATSRETASGAVASVVGERIYGVIILLILGSISAAVSYMHFGDQVSLAMLIFGAIVLGAFLLLTYLIIRKPFSVKLPKFEKITRKIGQVVDHFGDFMKHRRLFVNFLIASTLFYFFAFMVRVALIGAFGEYCPPATLFAIMMVTSVLASVPISINGIGILDGSFIMLITRYGIDYETAIMVMVLHRILYTLLSLIGGLIYHFGGKKIDPDKIKQQPAL